MWSLWLPTVLDCGAVMTIQFNSLAPGKFEWNFRHVIFKQILVIDGWGISCEIALIWMWLDFIDDQPTLVRVMAWCHQATSHYLGQCWPRSLSSYGVTRPQWVNRILHTTLCWLRHIINHSLNSQQTNHSLPSQGSYGVFIVRILKKIDSIITTAHGT